jgi:hypothetical protein
VPGNAKSDSQRGHFTVHARQGSDTGKKFFVGFPNPGHGILSFEINRFSTWTRKLGSPDEAPESRLQVAVGLKSGANGLVRNAVSWIRLGVLL